MFLSSFLSRRVEKTDLLANQAPKTLESLNIDKIWIVGENPRSIDQKFFVYEQVKVGGPQIFGHFLMILQS